MAKYSTRVTFNRRNMDQVLLAIGDGILEVGKTVAKEADPPDATPYGVGLVTRGGVLVYDGNRKVGGWGIDGKQPRKPRGWSLGFGGINAAIGFGFPGRFQEFGTVKMSPQPFFMRAFNGVWARRASIIRQAAAYRIARLNRMRDV